MHLGSDSMPVRVETLAAGMHVPWDLAFAPDGRIFITEREGRIRVVVDDTLWHEPWTVLPDVYAHDPVVKPESGLMGIAIDPDFATNRHVYVLATEHRHSQARAALLLRRVTTRVRRALSLPVAAPWVGRIYRFTDADGHGSARTLIADGLPANYYHVGGALRIGPDGMLYVTVGDVLDSRRAQDPQTMVGTVLRLRKDGSPAPDNPFAGSPVYAYGLRNSQGLAWHPSGALFAIDHGPSMLPHEEGRHGRDELNVIEPGFNYGWPVESGLQEHHTFAPPIRDWTPGIAPGGLAFYRGTLFGWENSFLVSGLRGQQLRRVEVGPAGDSPGWRVVSDEVLLLGQFGRIRAVRAGPDGAIYLTTSNRDGRGVPMETDDRLLRLTPIP
jgi:aldose sugar dehydrogenase